MSKYFKNVKPCPTDLTWEERNPFSYLLDVEAINEIEQAIEKYKKEKSGLSKLKEQQNTFEKNK